MDYLIAAFGLLSRPYFVVDSTVSLDNAFNDRCQSHNDLEATLYCCCVFLSLSYLL